ncbi:MAG: ABC transporter substrate-binding protein [Holosporales bacterium]|nr:ABC transporter substrate-binding protein [Holosporales bacterium]
MSSYSKTIFAFFFISPLHLLRMIATVFGIGILAECPFRVTYSDEAAISAEAQQFIADFGKRAIMALTNPNIAAPIRQERFAVLLDEGFDVAAIGRFVLARHWRRLTNEQKQQFITLFRKMIVVNYAARFREFFGVVLQVKGATCVAQGGVNVESVITLPRGGQVKIIWKMFPSSNGAKFKVVDVVLDGVSMGITQRSEFANVIQKLGDDMSAFLSDLDGRVQRAFNTPKNVK